MLRVLQDAILNGDRVSLLQTSEKLNDARNKDDFESNLEILLTLVRDAWTLRLDGPPASLSNTDILEQLREIAGRADAGKLAQLITEIERMREAFAVNINKRMAADALFMKMSA